jgi:hypothetical protein
LLILGRAYYVLKIVEFPKLKKALIDKAVKTNVGEWSPFKDFRYFTMSHPQGDKIVVLVAICRQDDYEDIAGLLASHGLKIDMVLPQSFCTESFFRGTPRAAVAVRGADGVELLFFADGIRDSQFFPASKWTGDSIAFFIKRLGPAGLDLNELLIVGREEGELKSFPEGLVPKFVRAEDDMDALTKGSDFFSSPWIKSLDKRRLALFAPEDLNFVKPGLLIVAGGILLFLAAQVAASWINIHSLKKEFAAVKEQSRGLEEQIDRVTTLRTRVDFVRDSIERYPSSLAVLWELQSCLAEDNYLQRYSFNKDLIEFTGLSSQSAAIIARLNSSKLFSNVRYKSAIEKDQATGKERFTIELRIKK